jgi:stress-induced morphogen
MTSGFGEHNLGRRSRYSEADGAPGDLAARGLPHAIEFSVCDRTGTGDHFQVVVASPRLDGLSLVEHIRLVYDALAQPLADRTIHELRIKTKGSR